MISEQAFEVLRSTTLFAGFTDEQLEAVPQVARPHSFAPGEVIVEEGELGARSLWLVLEGDVEIRVAGELLRVEGPGSHFGEMALLNDAPRSADVVARTAVTALQLSRDHLRGLIHGNPDVAIAMLAEMSRRLRRLTDSLTSLLTASPEAAEVGRGHGLEAASNAPPVALGPIEWGILFSND